MWTQDKPTKGADYKGAARHEVRTRLVKYKCMLYKQ